MARNDRTPHGMMNGNSKQVTGAFKRLDKQEAVNDYLNQEIGDIKALLQKLQQDFKTMATVKHSNEIQIDKLHQRISKLQEITVKDSKRISCLEQKRASDDDFIKNLKETLVTTPSLQSYLTSSSLHNEKSSKPVQDNLAYQLADDVTAIVGLKEAITWKYRWLKWIWAANLFVGVVATGWFVYATAAEYLDEPTATKIKMVAQPLYEYPPIFLCPTVWLDTPKALSLGLSPEGLKYSLGYINRNFDKAQPDNIATARKEFFEFFENHNYSSYDEYLMTISVDISVNQTLETFGTTFSTSAFCTTCKDLFLPKLTIDGYMCYKFQLNPSNSRFSVNHADTIGMKLKDQTMGLIETNLWRLYVNQNPEQKSSSIPSMIVKPLSFTGIRITSQVFSSLTSNESPCISQSDVAENYSSETCASECLGPLFNQSIACTPFDVTARNSNFHPKQLCNTFEANMSFWASQCFIETLVESIASTKQAEECYQNCPRKCQRTTYETTRQQDLTISEYNPALNVFINEARLLNVSLAVLQIENTASYEGGVMTWTEFSTISFTSLVSNVGGALGLFVGGTVMTFVQLILFFVKFALEKRNKVLMKNTVFVNTGGGI